METYEIKRKLEDYDKLINLYSELISRCSTFISLEPHIQTNTEREGILEIKALGKTVEVRFSMTIKNGASLGKITAFLVGVENHQPFERAIFTNLFDTLSNFTGDRPLISCGTDEDDAPLNLVHLILKNLIQNEITEPN